MKARRLCVLLAVAVVLAGSGGLASAEERMLVGADVGATGALTPMYDYVKTGAILSPFAGYMWNDYLGGLAQFHILSIPTDNNPKRKFQDDYTWVMGMTFGPRLALPLGDWEWYTTFQFGGFTGLSPNSPVTRTSYGISGGGGVNYAISETWSLGGFGRYNFLDQRVHDDSGRVQYATGGISVTFRLPPPSFHAGPSAAEPK